MKSMGQMRAVGFGAALIGALAAGQVSAEKVNPYLPIAVRNAFGLADGPPPPPTPPVKPEAPKPVSTVRLTGITTMLSKARALFEIVEAPGKPAEKPIMLVGEKVGDIELMAINVAKNQVTIRQSGVETNLVLEARKAPALPPGQRPGMAPGARPGFPPPGMKAPGQQTAAINPGGGSPMIIAPGSGGASSGRSGVITMGGNSSTPAADTASAAAAAQAGVPVAGMRMPRATPGTVPTPGGPAAFNVSVPNAAALRAAPTREIPQRPARTQSMPTADSTAEQQLLLLHLNEIANPGDGPPPPPMPE